MNPFILQHFLPECTAAASLETKKEREEMFDWAQIPVRQRSGLRNTTWFLKTQKGSKVLTYRFIIFTLSVARSDERNKRITVRRFTVKFTVCFATITEATQTGFSCYLKNSGRHARKSKTLELNKNQTRKKQWATSKSYQTDLATWRTDGKLGQTGAS